MLVVVPFALPQAPSVGVGVGVGGEVGSDNFGAEHCAVAPPFDPLQLQV